MLIRERVDRVLREQLGPGIQWSGDALLTSRDGLDLDSLDMVELVMRLEEEFVVRIPDDACDPVDELTVDELVARIETRLDGKPLFG
jgi:acyl carrier protein